MAELSVVIEKLHSFETADDLAEFFRGYGIQAQPRRANACAITKFVMEETGLPASHISTSPATLRYYSVSEDGREKELKCYCHTAAMMKFVENFDQGYYLDLVEEGYDLELLEEFKELLEKFGDD